MDFTEINLELKLDLYEKAFDNLKNFLNPLTAEILSFSPDDDHWTIKQIAIHLTDTEGIYFVRFRRTIGEEGYELSGFKNDDWAIELDYSNQDLKFNLQLLDMLRQSNLRILKTIPNEYWQNKTYKNKQELLPLEKLLERNLNHFYHHLDVIKKRYDQYKERSNN